MSKLPFILAGIVFAVVITRGQTPSAGPILNFTATTDNVSGAHDSIRIDLFRWSTDAERDQLLDAWNLKPPAGGRGGRGGRGGKALTVDVAPDPAAVVDPVQVARASRNGNGGGRGAAPAETRPLTPETSLTTALAKEPALGRLWSSEVAGYSIHSAIRIPEPDGGERILLITDRRLGAWNESWKPAGSGAATNYDFSVIELHVNSKGEGEGKISLTGKVIPDSGAKTLALENYGALPVILKNVRRTNPENVSK
jgi:hypothetical protein